MALIDDIKKEIKNSKEKRKKTKWQILKEYENEIKMMIENNIPLKKQIELILKNGILEKIDYKEYYNILVKYFNYDGKYKKQRIFKPQQPQQPHQPQQQKEKPKQIIDPVKKLSEDVDLLDLAYK